MENYQGINRKDFPDWFGWFIIDLMTERPNEIKKHLDETQVQLDYEVKLFYLQKEVV